jgi:sRNA-binding regulator protein Hfq
MKIQLKYVFLFIICLISFSAFSQSKRMEDVVYMKNGSIIRGVIVEFSKDYVKIETVGRNLFVFNSEEIEKIQKENNPRRFLYRESGFFNNTEIGWVTANRLSYQPGIANFGIQTVNGYKINRWVGAGVGIGLQRYEYFNIVPVFASLQSGDFFHSRITPYYYVNTGYGFGFGEKHSQSEVIRGGFMFNPGIGLKINSRESAFLMSFGYSVQKAYHKYESFGTWNPTVVEQNLSLNRISIRFGMSF